MDKMWRTVVVGRDSLECPPADSCRQVSLALAVQGFIGGALDGICCNW